MMRQVDSSLGIGSTFKQAGVAATRIMQGPGLGYGQVAQNGNGRMTSGQTGLG